MKACLSLVRRKDSQLTERAIMPGGIPAVLAMLFSLCLTVRSEAQQDPGPPREELEEIQGELEFVPEPSSLPELADDTEMAALFQRLKELRGELKQDEREQGPERKVSASHSRPGADMINLMASELESSRQVDELGGRIQALLELQKQRQAAAGLEKKKPEPDNSAGGQSSEGNESLHLDGGSGEKSATRALTGTEKDSLAGNSSQVMLAVPSDQILLAESLYYTGEIALALDVLKKIRAEKSDQVDVAWIDYQISGCHRRIGDIDKSTRILRSLTEISPLDPVCDQSKWLLDHVPRRERLQQELEIFRGFLEPANKQEGHANDPATKQQ